MIVGLVVRYGQDRYPAGTADAIAAIRRFAGSREHEIVVIDNSWAAGRRLTLEPGVRVRSGDNALREFTAWDCVLRELVERFAPDDVVVLVTDALRQGDAAHLDGISGDAPAFVGEWPAAYGHLDAVEHPVGLPGLTTMAWLRSSFVALSAHSLRRVLPLAEVRVEQLFSSPVEPLSFRPVVPAAYRELLCAWLLGRSDTLRYHRARALHERSVHDFQVKAACIVNEHALSARLARTGVSLFDLDWWRCHDGVANAEAAALDRQLAWIRAERGRL